MLPEAKSDIKEASKWYDKKQIKLGKAFRNEVKLITAYIQQYPEGFEIKYNHFRGCIVNRFPYIVFYRMHQDTIVIVAVLADKQNREEILSER